MVSSFNFVMEESCNISTNEKKLTFNIGEDYSSPVYIQRYEKVSSIVEEYARSGKISKVIDFGTGQLNFIKYIKKITQLTKIAAVDIDESLLQSSEHRVAPLAFELIMDNRRMRSLDLWIFAGSIADIDERLLNYDAVICIELIEHLESDVLTKACKNIFGFLQPKLAIFTTPNADFNILFPELKGFRHWDHKFEWSREEFKAWCLDIIKQFPNYQVEISGIGEGPPGSEHLGSCSQLAVFTILGSATQDYFLKTHQPYKLIAEYHYPCKELKDDDNLFYSAMYHVRYLGRKMVEESGDDFVKFPLERIQNIPSIAKICPSEQHLRTILANNGVTLHEEEKRTYIIYCFEDAENSLSESDENESLQEKLQTQTD